MPSSILRIVHICYVKATQPSLAQATATHGHLATSLAKGHALEMPPRFLNLTVHPPAPFADRPESTGMSDPWQPYT